jgi:signal transduction histidine kinase
MLVAPIPADEKKRLDALHRYCVLDTPAEPAFDRLTDVAAHVLKVPTALVSLVDDGRQWFKSRRGMDASETPRAVSFCAHAVYERRTLVVPDATLDPRFADNPLVTGELGLRFYAGAPLVTADGLVLGTLCAIDYAARPAPTTEQIDVLRKLADAVVDALELRLFGMAQTQRMRLLQAMGQMASCANSAETLNEALAVVLAELCTFTGACAGHAYLQAPGHAGRLVSSGVWHGADTPALRGLKSATRPMDAAALFGLPSQALAGISEPLLMPELTNTTLPRAHQAAAQGWRSGLMFALKAGHEVVGMVECYGDMAGLDEVDFRTLVASANAQLGRLVERERSEQAMIDFVGAVSRELRSPLDSIAGSLEVLERLSSPPRLAA